MDNSVLILPEWMVGLKFFDDQFDIATSIGIKKDVQAEYVVGLSLGALIALKNWNGKNNLILINPPLPKRNFAIWLIRWVKFISSEGLFFKRQKFTKNPLTLVTALTRGISLLSVDFSKKLDEIPPEKVLIIKGNNDVYFCDDEAVDFFVNKNIRVLRVEDSGHNWSAVLEKCVKEAIK